MIILCLSEPTPIIHPLVLLFYNTELQNAETQNHAEKKYQTNCCYIRASFLSEPITSAAVSAPRRLWGHHINTERQPSLCKLNLFKNMSCASEHFKLSRDVRKASIFWLGTHQGFPLPLHRKCNAACCWLNASMFLFLQKKRTSSFPAWEEQGSDIWTQVATYSAMWKHTLMSGLKWCNS